MGRYCICSRLFSKDHRVRTDVFSVLNKAPISLLKNLSLSVPGDRTASEGTSSQFLVADHKPARFSGMLVAYQIGLMDVSDVRTIISTPVSHRYVSEKSRRNAVDHAIRHAIPGG